MRPTYCYYIVKYIDKTDIKISFRTYCTTNQSDNDNIEYLMLYAPIGNVPTKKVISRTKRLEQFIKIYYRKFVK